MSQKIAERSKSPKESNLQVKNKWIYYGAIFDRYISIVLGNMMTFSFTVFLDSMSNANNHNWTPAERQSYLGYLTSSLYLGSAIGSLCVGFLTRFNTRYLYVVLRALMGFSILPYVFGDIKMMIIGRFLIGFTFDAAMEVSVWSLHQILLPKDKERFLTLLYLNFSIGFFLRTLAANLDNGGFWYWRMYYLVNGILIMVWSLLSLFLIPYVNSLSFLMDCKGEEETLIIIGNYYEQDTAQFLVDQYKKDFYEIAEVSTEKTSRELNGGSEGQRELIEEDYTPLNQPQQQNTNARQATRNSTTERTEMVKRETNSLKVFFRDLKLYHKEVLHIIIFSITSMLSFNETMAEFSLYLLVKIKSKIFFKFFFNFSNFFS